MKSSGRNGYFRALEAGPPVGKLKNYLNLGIALS
jgi:hypothetical protein